MKLEMISKVPPINPQPTPLLFVHGAWHGAWCWDVHFLDYFAQHGFAAHAVSLRGHGNSEGRSKLRGTRIADYVQDVAAAAFAKVNLTLSLFPLVATPQLAREAFFSAGLAEEQAQIYAKRLQDESYLGFLDMLVFNLPKPEKVKTPLLILGAAKDTIFSPAEVQATGRAYSTQAEIFTGMAHDMMLEPGWQAVADRILAWLKEREL